MMLPRLPDELRARNLGKVLGRGLADVRQIAVVVG